jgi:tetratricopeptide (TPR) repeat protein
MRRSPILLFLLGFFFLVVPLAAQDQMAAPSDQQGSIQGVLRDATTGREVADAKVELSATTGGTLASAITNSTGQFLLDSVPAGSYTITVQHPDYLPLSQQVSAEGHAIFGLQLSLRKKPGAGAIATGGGATNAVAPSAPVALGPATRTGIPRAAQDAMNKGMDLLYVKSDLRGSLDQFDRAIKEYPGFYEAYTQAGIARVKLGESGDAEKAFRKAIELSQEKYSDAYSGLAVVLSDGKYFTDAEVAARKAVELNPNDWRGQGELGRALHAQQRYQEAEAPALVASRLAPDNPTLKLMLSSIHLQLKDLPAMLDDLDAYLKLVPKGPDADRMRDVRAKVQKAIDAAAPAQTAPATSAP